MEIGEVRVDNPDVGTAVQLNTAGCFMRSIAMEPHPVEDDMIERSPRYRRGEGLHKCARRLLRNFESNEAVVIGAGLKKDGSGVCSRILDLCEHVIRGSAVQRWSAGQGTDSCVARSQPGSFGWQSGVRSARSNRNPVVVITTLCREL